MRSITYIYYLEESRSKSKSSLDKDAQLSTTGKPAPSVATSYPVS